MDYLQVIKQNKSNPVKLSDVHLEISIDYANLSEQLINMLPEISEYKNRLIESSKSMAHAEKIYDSSDLGMKEKMIKTRLKSYEKIMSGIKRRLDNINTEYDGLKRHL